MKTLIIILISFLSFNLFGQINPFNDKPEEYLMPEKDTMDVIKIAFADIKKYTLNVGKYSAIVPVVLDTLYPKGVYFLPHRILYDEDLKSIWNLFKTEEKNYLKISTKTLIKKTVSPQLIPK